MRIRTLLAVLLVGLIAATTGWAQGLPAIPPSEVGLSEERLARLAEVVQSYVDDDAIAGAVTLIARKGGQAHRKRPLFPCFVRDRGAGSF